MVLLPGCNCCIPCPRPCPSIRYIAIRFQVAAASGSPLYSSLPLTVTPAYPGYSSYTWTPPGVLSSVSSPAIDETLIVDLWQQPNFSVSGTYGNISVNSSCIVSYRFSHSLALGTWHAFDPESGQFRRTNTLTETVTVFNSSFPLGVWGASQFVWQDNFNWMSPFAAIRRNRTVSMSPSTFRECSNPGVWAVTSETTSASFPVQGESYNIPEVPGLETRVVPYYDPGPWYYPHFFNPAYVVGEGYLSPLLWRRILPDPQITITVS